MNDNSKSVLLIVVVFVLTMIMLYVMYGSPYPTICQYGVFINGEYKVKTVKCLKSEDKGINYTTEDTETPTPEYIYPTETEWQPWSTETPVDTLEVTSEPYPVETATPGIIDPYPEPKFWW
jgi:hypothetical protein